MLPYSLKPELSQPCQVLPWIWRHKNTTEGNKTAAEKALGSCLENMCLAPKKVEDRFFLGKEKKILYQAGLQTKVLKKILNVFALFSFWLIMENKSRWKNSKPGF